MTAAARRVLILQHLTHDGPAGLAQWLRAQGVAFDVFNTEAGDAFPASMAGYDALAVLGGEMGANDPLPSLRRAEALILESMAQDRPVLGLCLGAQLMARALGARVAASPAPEVGWHRIDIAASPLARAWFGDAESATVFQWHYDAFDLPPNAALLASSAAAPHQAFAIGRHLGLQFHAEVDAQKVATWAAAIDTRYDAAQASATVHDPARLAADTQRHLKAQQALAERLYARWLSHQEMKIS